MTPLPETPPEARRLVYSLLITLAVGLTLGRLASVERVNEPSVHKKDDDTVPRPAWPKTRPDPWPTFSSNDRSRWALARALVEEGTFVIGRRGPAVDAEGKPVPLKQRDTGIIFEDGWQSVDKVMHPVEMKFYSTKPPLLSVIAAGEYWVLRNVFGLSIVEDRKIVIPLILVTLNVLPLVLYLSVIVALVERMGLLEWSRYFVVGAAGFATMVSPFLITFNNHTVATTAVAVAVYGVVRIREGGGKWWFLLAGLAAGFSPCNDLPALALAAGLGAYLLLVSPGRALAVFLPAALVSGVAMFGLIYAAFGELTLAYAKFGGPWYQYEGSHWIVPPGGKRGIDFAGETKAVYAFHLLVGHHGWFSLMPIMLLALPGMVVGPFQLRKAEKPLLPLVATLTLLVSVVVFAFYIVWTNNYGGWSNGPRWLMWLTPLWLWCMLPALDVLGKSRWGRGLALVLLMASMLSMSYQMWNPWRHPWIYNWMEANDWIKY